MLPDMLALPGEHRHGRNPRTDLRRGVEQIGIDLAAIQNGVEKLPFVRCHDEQEREPFPTERNGFFYPSVDVAAAGEAVPRHTDGELLAKLARVTLDGIC